MSGCGADRERGWINEMLGEIRGPRNCVSKGTAVDG